MLHAGNTWIIGLSSVNNGLSRLRFPFIISFIFIIVNHFTVLFCRLFIIINLVIFLILYQNRLSLR